MGDISAEPSMEDILSSIKRIIAEEGEAVPIRQRRAARPAAPAAADEAEDDESDLDAVLELNDPIASPESSTTPTEEELPRTASSDAVSSRSTVSQPVAAPAPAPAPPTIAPPVAGVEPTPNPPAEASPILSQEAASATRGSLDTLSRLMLKPEPSSDGTLEGMVREMLRPMLRDWLDAKLPPMVEGMVAAEIARITGQGR